MSPIERKTIRIEGNQILADGNGEDAGKIFKFVCSNLEMTPQKLRELGLANTAQVAQQHFILGPDIFDARGRRTWKNQSGISFSKKRRLGFYPGLHEGYWQEVDNVQDR